jgi:hypothetical protein
VISIEKPANGGFFFAASGHDYDKLDKPNR